MNFAALPKPRAPRGMFRRPKSAYQFRAFLRSFVALQCYKHTLTTEY
ncbi:hypothetical protein BLA17378_08354 [Burkholderia aenigmatica]|uniref:Uncharacterized protein n=1 Tax=Burkholderia aenigmatica TaxID=2015348 RepID=A0ABY6Y6N5_9BURK|nr:hypothetical protein BLA17378_08354 [Burkholderia aenigmatica]VWD54586.1 hypothetical protein BLA18628_06418 [Burkholderia aenigmatica]